MAFEFLPRGMNTRPFTFSFNYQARMTSPVCVVHCMHTVNPDVIENSKLFIAFRLIRLIASPDRYGNIRARFHISWPTECKHRKPMDKKNTLDAMYRSGPDATS